MTERAYKKLPPAFPSMRIGLLGGSFNPAHEGHLRISVTAIKRLGLDKLWWMVTPGNPLKGGKDISSLPDRVASARTLATHPKIEITAFEADRPSPYARDTIDFLLQRYRGVHFVWIMGGDNLAQFHHWRDWTTLFFSIPILAIDRPSYRCKALASPAGQYFSRARIKESTISLLPLMRPPAWSYLSLPLCGISSTAIREKGKT
jgi:nicotinate-nucleotide adenylyltransferase